MFCRPIARDTKSGVSVYSIPQRLKIKFSNFKFTTMRKIALKLLLPCLVYLFALGLSGCQKQEIVNQDVVDYSILPYLSKNEKVLSEIQFLVDEKFIKKEQIADVRWTIPQTSSVSDSNVDMLLQGYILSGTDIGLGARFTIQQEIDKRSMNTGNSAMQKHSKRSVMANTGSIKVRMMSLSQLWRTAITDACTYWNSKGYTVSFTPYNTTSTSAINGEINVVESNTSNIPNYVATQPPASNGNPGLSMIIYTKYDYAEPIISAKKHAITHELGHALGFGHTDLLESGMSWITNTNISSACRNNPDPSSIMKSTMNSYYPFNGFTSCDGIVFDWYY